MPAMRNFPVGNVPSRTAGGRRCRTPNATRAAVLAVGVAVAIAGCSTSSEPTTSQASNGALPAATSAAAPEGSALKPIDPATFQAAVNAAAEELLVPGAVVQLRTPQGTFGAVVGTAELGAQTPPDEQTHFRIASNTKTMTAALTVLLAQDGKLEFSDPVSTYVSDVPNGENITVAELLTMRR